MKTVDLPTLPIDRTPSGKVSTWDRRTVEILVDDLVRELAVTKEELRVALDNWRQAVIKQ